jgi:SAM-dependent methyltransferase
MKDNFSNQASLYAKYRPTYPPSLFDFILSHVKGRDAAWDCATGNGQTAKELAKHFEKVYATDISQKQLDHAEKAPNIIYSMQPAETTNFPPHTFDLVTVSQALHWFQFDQFYEEVRRVCKKDGWLAVWMYDRKLSPQIDSIISESLYKNLLGEYWDNERKHVDQNYRTIPFPFEEVPCPEFVIRLQWTLDDLKGYLNSWSAVQKFIAKNNYNPVDEFILQLKPHWTQEKMEVEFPITLRMGKVY